MRKRPASSQIAPTSPKKLKQPTENGAPSLEKHDVGAENEKMDPERSRAWTRMKNRGEVPEHIQKVFSSLTSRAQRASFINNTIVANNPGSTSSDRTQFSLDTENPVVKEFVSKFREVSTNNQQRGLPKSLMAAKLGGQKALEQAIADDDVFTFIGDDGKEWYAYKSMEINDKNTVSSGFSSNQDQQSAMEDHQKLKEQ